MVIGITLNEVLREFTPRFEYVYNKYIDEVEYDSDDIKSLNLLDYFKFDSVDELNKFLYIEAALEVFGHAEPMYDNIMKHFNLFLNDIKDDEEHQIKIISREILKSKPATLFFLSKLSCEADDITFVQNHEDKWDYVDVLITANPKALETKPAGKISVKINASYNKNSDADFELDSIVDFFKDESLRDKILNTKITTFEN